MDAERVESRSRSLPLGLSRRRALVAALGGALGAAGPREATAKKKKNNTKKRFCRCQLGYHCVKGKCTPDATTAPPVAS